MPLNRFARLICTVSIALLIATQSARAQSAPVDPKSLDYSEIGSNNSGKVLYASKKADSSQTILMAAMHDVEKILGARVTVTSAFNDQQKNLSGGANFTATVNGTAIKGSVLVGVGANGTSVSIVYASASAPAADWSALLADLPSSINLTTTSFGNGVGTIGVPDGWKIAGSDNTGTVALAGPNNEQVMMSASFLVLLPGSQGAMQQNQMARMAIQFGHKPLPGNPIAQIGDPAQSLANLTPFFSQNSVANGGPSQQFKEVISQKPQPSQSPNVSNAVVYSSVIMTSAGQSTLRRSLANVSVTQLPPQLGEWHLELSVVSAPDAVFDQSLPTMLAIWNSYNPNVQQALANGRANMAAMQATFKQFQANMKATEDATDQMIADQQAQEMASDRSSADFDEVIRGYRTVEDTQTGDQADVNLADSHAIVDKLNEGDPGRYVEIPLRDTLDPY
jgi:hypothetical protein